MKVKLIASYHGARGNHQPGEVIDVPDAEGQQLIDGRYAAPDDGTKQPAKPVKPAKRGGK